MADTPISGGEVPLDAFTTFEMLEDNPVAVYAWLRKTTPIVRLKALGGRIIFTKAKDVTRVKTDAEHFWSSDTTTPMQRAFGGHTLMRKDGCQHLRERHAMEPAFTPEYLENWSAAFKQITDNLLDKIVSQETVDLASAFAKPLSVGYLKCVLGIDDVSSGHLFEWANALVRGAMNAGNDPEIFFNSDQANTEMDECFDKMIEQYQISPDKSVLSAMVNAQSPIALSQVRTNMKICIGGAVIETRDALLSTLYGLLNNPEQLLYCIDTNNWSIACEEGLRWVAPIQASPRIVKKAMVMRGLYIPEGETVMAVQGSANHDSEFGPEPERFNIHRNTKLHQSFGEGAHACLGGSVYRLLVAQIALPKLFTRFPELKIAQPDRTSFKGFAFRGPKDLQVRLSDKA
ncbi:MAG: cytochrome P450 [Alphaproteobacteria bacterium]|nr:cytochrome P450 [Alphaproteobacteria bacterium]